MEMKEIKTGDVVVAHIYDMNIVDTKIFSTPSEFAFQFGVGFSADAWTSKAHIHKPVKREVEGTAELIFILKGQLGAIFYDCEANEIGRETLGANMALLQITGGHELTFGPGTAYFELKQGPYFGRDWDKYEL